MLTVSGITSHGILRETRKKLQISSVNRPKKGKDGQKMSII